MSNDTNEPKLKLVPLSDTFRIHYVPLSDKQKQFIKEIKERATILLDIMAQSIERKFTREYALAKTNLQQAIMWIVNGISEVEKEEAQGECTNGK